MKIPAAQLTPVVSVTCHPASTRLLGAPENTRFHLDIREDATVDEGAYYPAQHIKLYGTRDELKAKLNLMLDVLNDTELPPK